MGDRVTRAQRRRLGPTSWGHGCEAAENTFRTDPSMTGRQGHRNDVYRTDALGTGPQGRREHV